MKTRFRVNPKTTTRRPVKASWSPFANIPMLALNALDDLSTLAGALEAQGDTGGVQYIEDVMKGLERIANNYE